MGGKVTGVQPNIVKAKTVLVGPYGVGKTSILSRYYNNHFNNESEDYQEHFEKIVDLNGIHVNFVSEDTCSTEKFRLICHSFYHGCIRVGVVFSLDDLKSLKDCEAWINDIPSYHVKKSSIILLGNKSDLQRTVPKEEANALAERHGIQYVEVSAKDNVGIDSFFAEIISHAYVESNDNQE